MPIRRRGLLGRRGSLEPAEVRAIRRSKQLPTAEQPTNRDWAAALGVDERTVSRAAAGKSYSEVDERQTDISGPATPARHSSRLTSEVFAPADRMRAALAAGGWQEVFPNHWRSLKGGSARETRHAYFIEKESKRNAKHPKPKPQRRRPERPPSRAIRPHGRGPQQRVPANKRTAGGARKQNTGRPGERRKGHNPGRTRADSASAGRFSPNSSPRRSR
jgi:hypothetical protein